MVLPIVTFEQVHYSDVLLLDGFQQLFYALKHLPELVVTLSQVSTPVIPFGAPVRPFCFVSFLDCGHVSHQHEPEQYTKRTSDPEPRYPFKYP